MNIIGIGIVLSFVFVIVNRFFVVPAASPEPENLGVTDGQLAPCPDSPNCVSSQANADDKWHYIEPIALNIPVAEAHDILVTILNDLDRSEIETNQPTYIHATTRSFTMGYIDDLEFYIDEANGQIHVRSAARLGGGDWGVNRQRMEMILQKYLQATQVQATA